MHIVVFVDPAIVWRWHKWFIERLQADGYRVDICLGGRARALSGRLRLLLQFEHLLYRSGEENASDLMAIHHFSKTDIIDHRAASACDLMIDLAGETDLSSFRIRCFRPCYEGLASVHNLIETLLDGRAPQLALTDSAKPGLQPFGRCAIEQPELLHRGLNNVFSRMAGLLLKSVRGLKGNPTPPSLVALPAGSVEKPALAASLKAERFLLGNLAAKITNRLNRLVRKGSGEAVRWGTGWRFTGGQPVRETNDLSLPDYVRLKDDGRRFFADPFVKFHQGLYHVFVEEFPFDTQRGIISHFTIDEQGVSTAPREVLSRPYHLSYPFIFEHGGQFWMIPETSANRAVELYRAERFPDKWVLEKTLIDDIRADDATLVHHEDRWWLFAAVSDWQSSQWDTLGLFYADDLFGEWSAHQANPVLLDPTAARPAGAMYHKNGALWRPAQDCSTLYGGGLSLCRVDRLDPQNFEQSVQHRLAPASSDALLGLHTLNEDQGLEVIDFFGQL